MGVPPYIVHQTFQYGGVKGKRHRLREAMLWRDPKAYYSEGQFLHAELAVLPAPPDFEELPEFNMSIFHLKNMELQLLQVCTGTCTMDPTDLAKDPETTYALFADPS